MLSKNQKTFIGMPKAKIETIKIFKSNTKQILLGAVAAFLLFSGLFVLNDPPKDDVAEQTESALALEAKKTNDSDNTNSSLDNAISATDDIKQIKATSQSTPSESGVIDIPGQPLEGKPIFYVNATGNDSTGDGSKEKPYKTPNKAVTTITEGGTVYIQSNITFASPVTFSDKTIKIMSDPEADTIYTLFRGYHGAGIFTISGATEFFLDNIIIDGKKSTYSSDTYKNNPALSINGEAGTNPTATMYDGVIFQNNYTTNGAAVLQLTEGTFNMYGGIMQDNKTSVGLTSMYGKNAKALNLLGGTIINNTKTAYAGSGCVNISEDKYKATNIGGNIKIINNTVQGSLKNVMLYNFDLNVVEDFSGEVYVSTTSRNAVGDQFGVIKNDATIYDGSFRNDSNAALYGGRTGNILLWKNLSGIKSERLDDLDALLAQYNEEDYSEANWAILKRYITDAKSAVKATTTYDQLKLISISGVKTDCDSVLTLAQEAAIAAINAAVADLVRADYSDDNWALIIAAQEKAINNIKNSDDIDLAKNDGLEEIASVLTIKGAAIAALDAYLANIDNPSDDVIQIIEDAKDAIEDCEDPSEVGGLLTNAINEADDQIAEELCLAKEAAVAAINGLVSALDFNEYSEANWQDILEAQRLALEAIEAASVIEDVILEKNTCIEIIEGVQSYRDIANSELDAYVEGLSLEDPSDDLLEIIEDAKKAIDDCENLEDLPNIVSDAIALIDIQIVKDEAKAELDAYLETIDNPSEDTLQMIKDAKEAIDDAEDLGDLPGIVSDAKDDVDDQVDRELQDAKDKAIQAINDEVGGLTLTDYSQDNQDAITAEQGKAIDNINAATTISGVNNARDDGLDEIRIILTLKGEAIAELDAYLETIDNPSDDVLQIIKDAKEEIEDCDDPSELEGIVSSAKDEVDYEMDEELQQAKIDAIAAINDLVEDGLDLDDYSETNQDAILDAQRTAIDNINAADTISGVNSAKDNGVEAIESVLTQKEAAIKELDDHLASFSDPSADVIQIIEDAKGAINDEDDLSALAGIVADAKASVALQIAKEVAKADLDAYLEALVDEPSAEILDIVDDAKDKIDVCENISEIEPIVIDAKDDVDDQVVLDLQAAKDKANEELTDYLANLADEASAATIALVNTARDLINASSNIYSLEDIVSSAKDDVDKQVAEELAQAQAAAKAEINGLVDSLNPNDYTPENWQAILDAETEAIYNILRGVTNIEDVNAAKEAGLEAINSILTIKGTAKAELDDYLATVIDASPDVEGIIDAAKTAIDLESDLSKLAGIVAKAIEDSKIQIAKDAAKAELDAYIEELVDPSQDILDIIERAHGDIQACTDLEGFDVIIEKAKEDIDIQLAKEYVKDELDAYLEGLNLEEDPSAEVLEIITKAVNSITKDNYEDAEDIISAAKDAIDLQLEKEKAIKAINDEVSGLTLTDYSPENQTAITTEQGKAIDNINDATTIEGVHDARDDGLDEIRAIPTLKEEAKDELDAYLATVVDASPEVEDIIDTAKDAIDDEDDLGELAGIVAKAIEDAKIQLAKEKAETDLDAYLDGLGLVEDPSADVLKIISDAVDSIKKENYTDVEDIIQNAKEAIDLQLAKEEAKAELDAYLEGLNLEEDPSDEVLKIISDAVDSIKKENYADVEDIIQNAKEAIDLQLAKEEAKAELDDYLENLVDASSDVEDIIDAAKVAIDLESDLSELAGIVAKAIEDAEIQIAKDEAKAELDAYLATIIDPSTDVEDIIDAAKTAIDNEADASGLAEIVAKAIEDAELQVAKDEANAELDAYLANSPFVNALIENIIRDAKDAIDDETQISEILELVEEAKRDVNQEIANHLEEAKSGAIDDLNDYLRDIENPSDEVKKMIEDAIKAIDDVEEVSELITILSETKEHVDAQVALELQEAKDKAKKELDDYLLTLADPASEISKGIVETAKGLIDACEKISEIGPIVGDAKDDVDDQVDRELQEAKDKAIQAINDEVDGLTLTDYSQDNQDAITAEQGKAIDNINNATTIVGVNNARDDGLDEIRVIPTLKEEAIAELDDYLATITDPSTDVEDIIDAAKDAIDSEDDLSELEGIVAKAIEDAKIQLAKEEAKAELDAYIDELEDPSADVLKIISDAVDSIKKENYTAVEDIISAAKGAIDLQLAKEEAKDELDAYIDELDDPSSDVLAIITKAVNSITEDNYSDVEDIIQNAKDAIDLQLEKEEAIKAINDEVSGLTMADYSPENQTAITSEQGKAIDNINDATTIEGVHDARDDGLDAIRAIPTLKEEAKSELDAYLATVTDPSSDVEDIIDTAKDAIDDEDDLGELAEIVAKAIEDTKIQIAKEKAKDELDAYLDGLGLVEDPSADVLTIISDAVDSIKKENYADVEDIIQNAKEAIDLQLAKEEAIAELDDYLATVTDPSSDVENIIKDAKDAIDNEADASGLAAIVAKAIEDATLQVAKDEANAELDAYLATVTDPSTDVEDIIKDAKDAIDDEDDLDELAAIVSKAIEDAKLQVAKEEALQAIDNAVNNLEEGKYSPENWQLILDAQSSAIDDINDASTIDAVNDAKNTGLVTISGVPTLLETGYDEPIVDEEPDATSGGTATVTHPDLPGETIEIELPPLNGEDYDVTLDGDEVIYEYVDEETGVTVEVHVELPSEGFDEEVTTPPNATSGGTAIVTHPDLPGLEVEVELPALSEESYDIDSEYDEESMTGSVTYTYHDEETDMDITVTIDYDVKDLDMSWDVTDDATFNETGVLSGTSEDLPGVIIEIVLPELSEDDYDITDNGDGTSRYTLKNKNYGDIYFDVPNEKVKCLWPYIILELLIISGLLVWAIMKRRKNKENEAKQEKEAEEAKASMSVLPLLLLLVNYIPNGWQIIIPLLAAVIVLLALYVVYLYFGKKIKEALTKEDEEVIEETPTVIVEKHTEVKETIIIEKTIEKEHVIEQAPITESVVEEIITEKTIEEVEAPQTIVVEVVEQELETTQEEPVVETVEVPHEKVEEVMVTKTVIKEESITKEAESEKVVIVGKTSGIILGSPSRFNIIYDYSFLSRLHLNDQETDARYNEIKNHLLSYEGVISNMSWKQETFTYKGKMVAKLRLQGKTLRVFLSVDPNSLDSKYHVEDKSDVKSLSSTPTLQMVKGPRQLAHAIQLIDLSMKAFHGEQASGVVSVDYSVKKLDQETLIDMGLIRVKKGEYKSIKTKPTRQEVRPVVVTSGPTIIYDYSFLSRLHLNDQETDARYNEIKNHLLSYEGVSANMSWKQETFTYKGKMVAKLRLQGKTLRVFLSVDPNSLDSKYHVEDKSNIKSLSSTPTLQMVKGPRQLAHAMQLIDLSMLEFEGQKLSNYKTQDYSLKKIKRDKLVELGLVKVQNGKFTQ